MLPCIDITTTSERVSAIALPAPCSFARFLDELGNPPQALAGRLPQTIRTHISARRFGDFGAVLMAERPASADLSDRVTRWRAVDAATREDLPLRAHSDHVAEDRRFNILFVATPVAIMSWVMIGLIAAWLRGVL